MPVTEEQVREQLTKVIDPELFVNIVDLGLIYVIDLEETDGASGDDASAEGASEGAAADPETPGAESGGPPTPTGEAPADTGGDSSATAEAASADITSDSDGESAEDAPSGPRTNVKIEMTMTSPMCPAGPQLVGNSKQVVSQIEGVGEVEVKVVMDPPWTPDRMTDEAKDKLGIF